MIVFFEDGPITNNDLYMDGKEIFKVDAGLGYSNCRRKLRDINKNFPFDTKVYTNSLDALSNAWCWDDEKKMPMIYLRNDKYNWIPISELTTRELRRGHNLEKLYTSGAFCNVEV